MDNFSNERVDFSSRWKTIDGYLVVRRMIRRRNVRLSKINLS